MKNILNVMVGVAVMVLTACAGLSMQKAQTLKVTERVRISAPAAQVWQKVNNFGDLGAWHPAVAKTEITAGENNQVGAVRLLTLQDGGTITETLTAYDAKAQTYSYVINKGVLPVSDYRSTITVLSVGDAADVIWIGEFKRKDLSAEPAKGQGDQAAVDTMHAVYQAGLSNLKKVME